MPRKQNNDSSIDLEFGSSNGMQNVQVLPILQGVSQMYPIGNVQFRKARCMIKNF